LQTVLDTKTSQRIFELAKDQQQELEIGNPLVQQDRSVASRVPRSQTIEEGDLSDEDGMDSGQSVVDYAEEIFVSSSRPFGYCLCF
jgi:essential nuclear protein 1